MSTLQERVVEEARSWAGTPFRHQGRLKGLGVDCAGFVALVAKGAGLDVEIPANYRPREDGSVMRELLDKHMKHVKKAQPGDVIAFCDEALREPDIPRHLAIVSEVKDHTMFIVEAAERGVLEHRLNSWWVRRIHSIWRLK